MYKKNRFLAAAVSAAVLAAGLALAGCDQLTADNSTAVANLSVEQPAFTGSVSSDETGIIAKGGARQFILTAETDIPVTWTVTGHSPGGGTEIGEDGLLKVGKNEAGITLVVRAESGDAEMGTAAVKVKGWKDITDNLKPFFDGNTNSPGQSKYMGISAAAYGNGTWVVAGHSAANWFYSAIVWSKDGGDTWTKAQIPLEYQQYIDTIVYGGPKGGEQFIIGGSNYKGYGYRSTDGVDWKRVEIMPSILGNGEPRHPVNQLVYGEVEGGGHYIATNGTNNFAYSSDGVTWISKDSEGNKLQGTEAPTHILNFLLYGTGIVDGKRLPMFRAWGRDTTATQRADVYTTTGTSWTELTAEQAAAQHFIPVVPSYDYFAFALKAMDVTTGPMFTGAIFRGDGRDRIFYGIKPPNNRFVPCADDESIYVYDSFTTGVTPYRYDNYVDLIVPGGGKYLAVGAGNRAAIAHAEAFE